MAKILFITFLFLLTPYAFSQKSVKNSHSLNSCTGGINIFEDGDFQLQFTGKKSSEKALEAYPSLSKINSENLIWVTYIAPKNGDLTFTASKKKGFVQMVIFEQDAFEEIPIVYPLQMITSSPAVGMLPVLVPQLVPQVLATFQFPSALL